MFSVILMRLVSFFRCMSVGGEHAEGPFDGEYVLCKYEGFHCLIHK